MQAVIKTPNKIWFQMSRELIKWKTSTKYQRTQKESNQSSEKSLKQQKTESVQKNSSRKTHMVRPLTNVRKI
jgi:hypothetical protein